MTLLGDGAKGWMAVFLAKHYMLPDAAVGLVAVAVFFGHLFPVFLKFKGGKGSRPRRAYCWHWTGYSVSPPWPSGS